MEHYDDNDEIGYCPVGCDLYTDKDIKLNASLLLKRILYKQTKYTDLRHDFFYKLNHITEEDIGKLISGDEKERLKIFNVKCAIIGGETSSYNHLLKIRYAGYALKVAADDFKEHIVNVGWIEHETQRFLSVLPDGFLMDGTCVEIDFYTGDNFKDININTLETIYPECWNRVQMKAYVTGVEKIRLLLFNTLEIRVELSIEADSNWIIKNIQCLSSFWNKVSQYRQQNPRWNEEFI
ncbi:hypothetical protein EON71_00675 [bacterium]|nr:MAG: hypothetical protein EON71_00675 [bacterium]